jgi:hypothetical protein
MNNIYIKYHNSNMPRLNITEVGDLGTNNRGGYGSTGR